MESEKQYDYARRIYTNAVNDPDVDFLEWEDVRESAIEQCDALCLDAEAILEHVMKFDEEMNKIKSGIKMCQDE